MKCFSDTECDAFITLSVTINCCRRYVVLFKCGCVGMFVLVRSFTSCWARRCIMSLWQRYFCTIIYSYCVHICKGNPASPVKSFLSKTRPLWLLFVISPSVLCSPPYIRSRCDYTTVLRPGTA